MFNFKMQQPKNFNEYTLIIPSISVGNVPQLTIDLLISTYDLQKAATIWHPAVVPSVGSDPCWKYKYNICTACELYISEKIKIAVIQLRSSLEPQFLKSFLLDFSTEIIDLKFNKIIILSSLFAYNMHNVTAPRFLYNANKLHLKHPMLNDEVDIAGCGYAIKLYDSILQQSEEVNLVALLKYCSEGDNRLDAIEMLEQLNELKMKVYVFALYCSFNIFLKGVDFRKQIPMKKEIW